MMATLPSPGPPPLRITSQHKISYHRKLHRPLLWTKITPPYLLPPCFLSILTLFCREIGFSLSFLVHPCLALRVLSTSKWPNQFCFVFFFLLVFKQTEIVLSTLSLSIPTLSKFYNFKRYH